MKRLALALALSGCTPDAPPPTSTPDAATKVSLQSAADASMAPSVDPGAAKLLAAAAVDDDTFARRVLYTWTTPAQIDELGKETSFLGRFLTRMESGAYGRSMFDVELDMLLMKDKSDPLAKALRGGKKGLSYRRFAWTTPWPTIVPLGTQSYGDQLLRVELRADAILARFESNASPRWRFVGTDGHDIPQAEALAHLERLGAILHVAVPAAADAGTGERAYREYVLCNESMIESFSYASPEALAELSASADLMVSLAKQPTLDPVLGAVYKKALAFPDVPAFAPTRANFVELERLLRAAMQAQTKPSMNKHLETRFDANPVPLPRPRRPAGPT